MNGPAPVGPKAQGKAGESFDTAGIRALVTTINLALKQKDIKTATTAIENLRNRIKSLGPIDPASSAGTLKIDILRQELSQIEDLAVQSEMLGLLTEKIKID